MYPLDRHMHIHNDVIHLTRSIPTPFSTWHFVTVIQISFSEAGKAHCCCIIGACRIEVMLSLAGCGDTWVWCNLEWDAYVGCYKQSKMTPWNELLSFAHSPENIKEDLCYVYTNCVFAWRRVKACLCYYMLNPICGLLWHRHGLSSPTTLKKQY